MTEVKMPDTKDMKWLRPNFSLDLLDVKQAHEDARVKSLELFARDIILVVVWVNFVQMTLISRGISEESTVLPAMASYWLFVHGTRCFAAYVLMMCGNYPEVKEIKKDAHMAE